MSEDQDRRRHLRIPGYTEGPVLLEIPLPDSKEFETVNCLMLNSSYSGCACICVGDIHLEEHAQMYLRESENIRTPCRLVELKILDKNVYRLAFEIL